MQLVHLLTDFSPQPFGGMNGIAAKLTRHMLQKRNGSTAQGLLHGKGAYRTCHSFSTLYTGSMLCQTHLGTFNKGEAAGFAGHHRNGAFHLTQVLVHVMLDQVLDQSGLANTRRAMNNHYKGWGLLRGGVNHWNCRQSVCLVTGLGTLMWHSSNCVHSRTYITL